MGKNLKLAFLYYLALVIHFTVLIPLTFIAVLLLIPGFTLTSFSESIEDKINGWEQEYLMNKKNGK